MYRKIVSLVMLYAFFIMVVSGIMLFISPFGRLAAMIKWQVLGLGKMDYLALHIIFMVIFTVAGILHIFYNFKAIKHYLKNRAKKMVVFTKEFIIATLITVGFFYATISHITPLEKFVKMDKSFNDYWIRKFKEERMRAFIQERKNVIQLQQK